MEVLNTIFLEGDYVMGIILFVIAIAVIGSILYIAVDSIRSDASSSVGGSYFVAAICTISLFALTLMSLNHIDAGVQAQYEVKITDFNEVYKNGYEIIGQRGDIYTVEKKGGR